ncbi:AAA family ATPase [Aphanizomenon flos-aquae NRERC-008]|jgi:predicted ATPase|uniref:AAA family ATPase n=1 Tax=Aphanizomenon flos-aquae FACHB-1249 TaxID=2692889 RepID=A0ABR8IP79_APHFL|nr:MULTISPECIES: AAA family ATPase [Aphanizomenon]MBD2391750.1 AAA family ATPase [Aphanizomenon flos-aquae FACHB-1171]MBD2557444.1 AAA family ATPase [Aphanizomenon flos-aquae FACHB-1290]MBD2632336.1 AAA family ATPase [Aphanizomenon sp. FACHB-1399]MBD2643203.1 AAA family ATPase [Aphanizomenon sp. FACHB-1401]MBD2657171.1 AAA family ATPase [Aphanizomenon flos-aquae FACHB-1265]
MKIESIHLKNFKAFKNVEIKKIPKMCVFVGANGTGKTTLFNVFSFLKDALTDNVHVALTRLGGGRGFQEVKSRNSTGPIEIELKFRLTDKSPLITYSLKINEEDGRPIIEREILQYRRGSKGQPWRFIDFSKGKGQAVINEPDQVIDEKELKREDHELKSPDILALKGLAQFEKFPASKAIGDLLENWHISDFHIQQARPERESSYAEHLSKEGENLAMVTEFLYKRHSDIFQKIIKKLKQRVPGISEVDSKITEEGRVLLRFKDGDFHDPFLARYVSDGTIKMFAYLVLLYDPKPHPLLCVEEPENQLYPKLLYELAEEFREYARKGGQVFVSTHSPDFLNGCELEEVFWLQKERGYTVVKRASDDEQITTYMNEGDKLGYLWRQGFFEGADPL